MSKLIGASLFICLSCPQIGHSQCDPEKLKMPPINMTKIAFGELGKSLQEFKAACGAFPTTGEGLASLIHPPKSCKDPGKAPFAKKIWDDPWCRPLIYESDGAHYTLKRLAKGKFPEMKSTDQD